MHRRMSLGFALMLLVVCLVGAVPASAEPRLASDAPVLSSFELLDWAWEWLTSLVSDVPADIFGEGGENLQEVDGGAFMDPNGKGGNG